MTWGVHRLFTLCENESKMLKSLRLALNEASFLVRENSIEPEPSLWFKEKNGQPYPVSITWVMTMLVTHQYNWFSLVNSLHLSKASLMSWGILFRSVITWSCCISSMNVSKLILWEGMAQGANNPVNKGYKFYVNSRWIMEYPISYILQHCSLLQVPLGAY